MQKSMVHELNPLIASNVQFSRNTFIHTVYENDFNQLRKSRIQNLPNYKKQDLSGKINFVVVFQAIQIQRLSVQVQTLRVKLKDYQRQMSNYDNYQVQIRELTQKCHIYQMQRQDHQQAMQKMHKICQQLYNELQQMRSRYSDIDLSLKQKYRLQRQRCETLSTEVQKWKARLHATQTSKIKQLEDMRMMLENQRKSMLQRQLRQLSLKYQSERKMLQSQLRKLREINQNKNNQLQRIRIELDQCKIRQGEFKHYQLKLDQYQDKLMMMAQENMRLNQLLRMKKQQIQNIKNNQRNLQNKINSFRKIQQQFNQINKKIQYYQIQIRQWTQKYSKLQAQNNKNLILSNKAQQYQKLLDKSADQMQRMNSIIRQKISQIQKWKTQTQRLSLQLQQTKATQNKVKQYQNQVNNYANENNRLNDILKSRLEQIQNWKLKYSEMQTKMPLLNQTQNQCKSLSDKLTIEINIKTQLMQRLKSMQNQLQKAAQFQHNLSKQKHKNDDLHKQIQRLNNSIRNISSQNNDYVRKINSYQVQLKQNSGLLQQLTECKRKIVQITQQLDRINGVLHQKMQQLKQLKDNYNSVNINTQRYKAIQQQFVLNIQQTQQLVLKLDQSRRENQFIQQKYLQLQGMYKKLEGDFFINNQEKEKLVSLLNQKRKQIQDCISRLQQADQKISQYMQIEHEYKNLKNSYSSLQQRCKQIQQKFSNQHKRSTQLSMQIQKQTIQINKLKTQSNFSKQFITQFISVKSQSQQKDKMISLLLQRINKIEQIILRLKQQNKKNYNNMTIYKEKWVQLNSNFESMVTFFNKVFELQDKFNKLAEENIELESSVRLMNATLEMNVQMAESSYAQNNWLRRDSSNFSRPSQNITIQERSQTVMTPVTYKQNVQVLQSKPKSSMTPTQASQSNYYQSQVKQINSNNYNQGGYSNISGYQQYTSNDNNNNKNKNNSYTIKSLRPGSSEVTTTYTSYNTSNTTNLSPQYIPSSQNGGYRVSETIISNNIGQSQPYLINSNSSQLLNNNLNNLNNNLNNLNNNYQYQYGGSQVNNGQRQSTYVYSNTTTTNNQAKKSQDNKGTRQSVLSPVRYFN